MVQTSLSSISKKIRAITSKTPALTEAQKEQFLKYGFVKLSKCFSKADADKWTEGVWTRLGYTSEPSTWKEERPRLPDVKSIPASKFAPKAWAAICELLGGEDRISDDWTRTWRDGFIVNCGKPEYRPEDELDFRKLDNWHTDGDFFVHFLDSPEQALLVIPLFTEIIPKGGGTVLCSDGIGIFAKHMYDHPEGVMPSMKPLSMPEEEEFSRHELLIEPSLARDEAFHEATGEVGDVFLLHPLMLHSASKNLLRRPRIITNPPVSLKEPFNLSRPDRKYSLVEKKTLLELGKLETGLGDWKITGKRRTFVPERVKVEEREGKSSV